MTSPSVTISIVTWNSGVFILPCIKALEIQTRKDIAIRIVDNASRDETLTLLSEEYPHFKIMRLSNNLGFSRAQNFTIALAQTPYILVLNPDVLLSPNFLEQAITMLEKNPELGSVQGKLLRFSWESGDDLREPIRSDILDTTGLRGTLARNFVNRGEGEKDEGQYDSLQDIFGPSGACALYRREALESVKHGREYFDEDFFAYADDSDLAWRLQRAGWKSVFFPDALAWHYRNVKGGTSLRESISARHGRPLYLRKLAAANAPAVLVKNLDARTFWKNSPRIIGREAAKMLYRLFREPKVIAGYSRFLRLLPRYLQKRRMIQRHQKVDPASLNHYFS
ncbi:MAG: glycosyltransferase family 2 protein [Patescibacteria group bacterium]|jgi:GT2 family glycosyltransferase